MSRVRAPPSAPTIYHLEIDMTISNCKFCQETIPTPELGTNYLCIHCQKYSLRCMENGVVESETLREGNYHLIFFPAYQEANIVAAENAQEKQTMKTFPLEDLTHEEAVRWVEKLRTYSIFQ